MYSYEIDIAQHSSRRSVTLLQNGRYGSAALYILGTVLLCFAFASLGCYVAGKPK